MARAQEGRDSSARLPAGARKACEVSTYHHELTGEMCASARDTLQAAGLAPQDLLEVHVPGSFELPLASRRLARRADIDAVLVFGLILKGETEHDRHIARAVSQGLMQVGLETDTPVLFGVLTTATLEQARARARRAADGGFDKGREVALAAIGVLHALRAQRAQDAPVGSPSPLEEIS